MNSSRLCAVVFAALLPAGCKDEGVERYQRSLEKYSECANRSLPPGDICFSEVLTELSNISQTSSVRLRADALRDALLAAQHPKIGTPLAVRAGAHLPFDVVGQLRQCQHLAEQLGRAAQSERPEKLRQLDFCRAQAEKLDGEHASHSADSDPH